MARSSRFLQYRRTGTFLAATVLGFTWLGSSLHSGQAQQNQQVANASTAIDVTQWRGLDRTQLAASMPGADTTFTVANWRGWDQVRLRWIVRTGQLAEVEFISTTPLDNAQAQTLATQQLGLPIESIRPPAAQMDATTGQQYLAAVKTRGYAAELIPATNHANGAKVSGIKVDFLYPAP